MGDRIGGNVRDLALTRGVPGELEVNDGSGDVVKLSDFWIACSERMPEPGTMVHFVANVRFGNNNTRRVVLQGTWEKDAEGWDVSAADDWCGITEEAVSHWMPLPELP